MTADPYPPNPGALFVDFENVFYLLVNEPFGLPRELALTATLDVLAELRRQLRGRGYVLVVERSYADWEKMPGTAQRQLQISGVLPKFVDSRIDKSTADIELSLDILHDVLTRPEIDFIALVGGDRDYLPILRRLKERHRTVCVCSFKPSLSGDVREFVSNYSAASIIELDGLVDLARYPRAPPRLTMETVPSGPNSLAPLPVAQAGLSIRPKTTKEYQPGDENYESHERYLQVMMRFMREKHFRDIHLGPFFRWLQSERVFDLVSDDELRRVFEELVSLDAVRVEERDSLQGHPFSVATLNYNHPLVSKVNET